MTRTWPTICLVVLLAVGVAQAQAQTQTQENDAVKADQGAVRAHTWGLGWEGGLTLRRQLGAWQLGVVAGPDDYNSDRETHRFDPALPDSLWGFASDSRDGRSSSRYVRLQVARQLAHHDNLVLSGVMGGNYSWSDGGSQSAHYYSWDTDWTEEKGDVFSDYWQLRLGARVAWYPVAFVSLEADFGLIYQWDKSERDGWIRMAGSQEWTREHSVERSHSFRTYDNTGVAYNLHLIIWL